MRPHIYLRKRSDTTKYGFLLTDPKALNEVNANPFTESAGVGGPYTELAGWQEWAQEDWMAGINQNKTDEPGALFSSAPTNVPGQVTLPPALIRSPVMGTPADYLAPVPYPSSMSNTLTACKPDTNIQRIATFLPHYGMNKQKLAISAYMKYGGEFAVTLYVGGAATPVAGAQLATIALDMRRVSDGSTVDPEGDPYWHLLYSGVIDFTAAGVWAVITLTDTTRYFYIPETYDLPVTDAPEQKYQNAAGTWVDCETPGDGAYRFPIHCTPHHGLYPHIAQMYAQIGPRIWSYANDWITRNDLAGTFSSLNATATVTSIANFAGYTYIAYGSASDMERRAGTDLAAHTAITGITANLLLEANGYLWRSLGTAIYYSNDGLDWTEVETPGRTVLALGSMEGELYYATETGLYYVAPGDYVVEVAPWPSAMTTGNFTMTNHQGMLWIATPDDLYRLDSGRSFVHDNPFQNTEAYQYKQQVPIALATTQTRFFVLMQTKSTQTRNPTLNLMEWTPEGWHQLKRIGSFKGATNTGCMLYEPTTQSLLFSTGEDNYYLKTPAAYSNPYINDEAFTFEESAWLEYPRFYGNRYLVEKHFDQVSLRSEGLGTTARVLVYYRSETVPNYTLLGTIDTSTEKLRWTGAALAGTWVQLAFLIQSDTPTTTPRIKATILKYQSLIGDRARWTVPIEIDASQQVDGWTYSAAGIVADTKTSLKAIIAATEPIIFTDIDDTEYEVSVQSYARQLSKYEQVEAKDQRQNNYVYTLILEQINPDEYTA